MVDTVKILGALLGGGGASKGSGANILKSVLGAATNSQRGGSNDLGSLLGGLLGGGQQQQSQGGMGDLLSSVLGGQQNQGQNQSGGGLGGLLGSLLGGSKKSAAAQNNAGGSLSDLLGGVLGGSLSGAQGNSNDSLGGLVQAALNQFGTAQQSATEAPAFETRTGINYDDANRQATLFVRAMIYAAKSDGHLDEQEQQKILGQLGDVTQEEIDFVKSELQKPINIDAFTQSVPSNMANQIYAMSLTAIDLDTNKEAQYLHDLAQGLNIDPKTCNQIHAQLGAPAIYS